ncbi:hypothetical protein GCM10007962_11620 [Yeosuana aromativorans]|uniref:Wadjet protein JetD C-terminal domain-containing protein n=1 Tax=Yeosuana aromativorans TaxID=288019 RepID=A0A8J3BG84_9FLAO|nr:hypothetical protein [Yeosuana aromativorans]GGK19101.1 hypothetical protein GCM10007962_11620 [Yeosuana aromativorans]
MNKNITWKELKALDDIYRLKKTRANIQEHPYIKYLIYDFGILDLKPDNVKIIITTDKYEKFYEDNFKVPYNEAKAFLIENGIKPTAKKSFTLEDVTTLMLICENKDEIINNPTNIEDFSNEFFDISKYLKEKKSVREAVFNILGIDQFPLDKKENHWRLVVDNKNPKAIVLCENKSFLKQPWIARNTEVKMWYVGGNNIKILDDIDEVELSKPIYYSCDWDLAGLQIYSRIKVKLKDRNSDILLLYPNTTHKRISTYINYHSSHWDLTKTLSGLRLEFFSKKELLLIKDLIQNEEWIEEESTDLALMIHNSLTEI